MNGVRVWGVVTICALLAATCIAGVSTARPVQDQLAAPTAAPSTGVEVIGDDSAAALGPPRHGRLAGRWFIGDANQPGGPMNGVWMKPNGQPLAQLVGFHHPLPPDPNHPDVQKPGVFHMDIKDNAGQVLGTLDGHYGNLPGQMPTFQGIWKDSIGEPRGLIHGVWRPMPNLAGGRFEGVWSEFNLCEEIASLVAPPPLTDDGQANPNNPPPPPPCFDPNVPHGGVFGHYMPFAPDDPNAPDADGRFELVWRGAGGPLAGAKGLYNIVLEPDSAPTPGQAVGVFFGPIKDGDGNVVGHVHGFFGPSIHGLSVFKGKYFDVNDVELGRIGGRWHRTPLQPGGPIRGFWHGMPPIDAP